MLLFMDYADRIFFKSPKNQETILDNLIISWVAIN